MRRAIHWITKAQAGLRGSIGHHVLLVIASYDGCADIVSAREIFEMPASPGSHRATLR